MKAKEIREMDDKKLETTLEELKSELFNLRFQHATGQLENPMRMGLVRKDIARIKTIMTERKLVGKEA
ncbi:MAG: 50S ribosomal protein L29 [Tissierellia bacterium]|nr:50S ribosomal protein L29 [Tissierellia bacterium]